MEKTYSSYPSLYSLGHAAVKELFFDEVIIEEKVDGSQFSFGVTDGQLQCRSKRCVLDLDEPMKQFAPAVATAKRLFAEGLLAEGVIYRGESLDKPKANTLCYDRAPAGNVIIFDIMIGDEDYIRYPDTKRAMVQRLGLECVPVLYQGTVPSVESLRPLLETVSVLGGAKVEGFVVKNYKRFGHDKKPLFGKFVSEAFKEIHQGDWRERNPRNGDIIQRLIDRYRTPARWEKALQHLRDDGKLTDSPRDIGALIKECQADILKECGDEMRDILQEWAWRQIAPKVVGGIPQWYKEKLMEKQFDGEDAA